jgi:hypothetical protein
MPRTAEELAEIRREEIAASPPCPRCGLKLKEDDLLEGYHPNGEFGPCLLKHAWAPMSNSSDGCIQALGRRLARVERLLASHSHGRAGNVWAGGGETVTERLEAGK